MFSLPSPPSLLHLPGVAIHIYCMSLAANRALGLLRLLVTFICRPIATAWQWGMQGPPILEGLSILSRNIEGAKALGGHEVWLVCPALYLYSIILANWGNRLAKHGRGNRVRPRGGVYGQFIRKTFVFRGVSDLTWLPFLPPLPSPSLSPEPCIRRFFNAGCFHYVFRYAVSPPKSLGKASQIGGV